jgi:hypothetical protein
MEALRKKLLALMELLEATILARDLVGCDIIHARIVAISKRIEAARKARKSN